MSNKKGEWLLVHGENFMSIQPQYCCSECDSMISTYDPPHVCDNCGSVNENKYNSISVSIEEVESESETLKTLLETTSEYFAKLAEDEMNVQKATDFLEKLGVKVKTEYGNYRPLYDVLSDIGNAMSRQ